MSRPPSTPPVKSEPRDSPLPTPHSAGSAPKSTVLRRGRFNENEGRSASPRAPETQLGQGLLKRARHALGDDIASNRPSVGRDLLESPVIDLSQDESQDDATNNKREPSNPNLLDNPPADREGPKLRYNQLDDDQRQAVDLATVQRKSICCGGGAGSGKSGCCEIMVDEFSAAGIRVVVVAPSGTSAVNVHAQTIHSFFGLIPGRNMCIAHLRRNMKHQVRLRIANTKVLIIDEISMVSYETWNLMDQSARIAHNEPDLAMGGMQIVVFGDFCQLPPVLPHEQCYQCGGPRTLEPLAGTEEDYQDRNVWQCANRGHGYIEESDKMWAFKSTEWDKVDFTYIQLRQAHRQHDPFFLSILAHVRHGKPFTPHEVKFLKDHDCDVTNAVNLTGRRDKASRLNDRHLSQLPGIKHQYKHQDKLFFRKKDLHPELDKMQQNPTSGLGSHPYEPYVNLKQGQPVILQRNFDVSKGLVNGSQGVIDHFIEYDRALQQREPSLEDGRISQLRSECVEAFMADQRDMNRSTKLPVVRFHGQPDLMTVFPDCSVKYVGVRQPPALLTRTQIPLLAGWALTIHKAQGMTLNKAVVDMDTWSSGMAYVALSRVKDLRGLKVEGLKSTTTVPPVDDDVKDFLKLRFGEVID